MAGRAEQWSAPVAAALVTFVARIVVHSSTPTAHTGYTRLGPPASSSSTECHWSLRLRTRGASCSTTSITEQPIGSSDLAAQAYALTVRHTKHRAWTLRSPASTTSTSQPLPLTRSKHGGSSTRGRHAEEFGKFTTGNLPLGGDRARCDWMRTASADLGQGRPSSPSAGYVSTSVTQSRRQTAVSRPALLR